MRKGGKLEYLIDMTNTQYRSAKVADVRKVPNPTKIKKVSGNDVSAKLGKAEWVDYVGVSKGRSIAFDAKESEQERFNLANLKKSQYEFLESWYGQNSITFLIVGFWLKNEPEIYVLYFEQLKSFWEQSKAGGPKSIPITYFRTNCKRVVGKDFFTAHYIDSLGLT